MKNYTKKDLISFGNYLLSDKRKELFQQRYKEEVAEGGHPVDWDISMKSVWDSDITNWEEEEYLKFIDNPDKYVQDACNHTLSSGLPAFEYIGSDHIGDLYKCVLCGKAKFVR